PRVSPFLRDAPPATAAVLVRLRPGAQLSEVQVTTIQTLVAAGVPRLKRTEVQVLDPRGILLGAAAPEPVQSQRLVLEQDLARRALAVLTPWLGEDRVSVQVTASLEDSETRQTVERVQNVGPAGRGRPLEKTVRTTRVPEGRIQRIHAIVILGFDASANEQGRARQMASQALGLQPARGDRLNVYALPGAAPKPQIPAVTPQLAAPPPVSQVRPASSPPVAARPFALPQWSLAAAAAALILLALSAWLRARRTPVVAAADFDAELDAVRSQVLADPRVTADVVKLWMRA
ncbi:MAG: flagellar M-ring protein FliF, partial [Thiobacillus sp.]|nr:flagellar M-ring protein FliF [Thiobacillus sp.]